MSDGKDMFEDGLKESGIYVMLYVSWTVYVRYVYFAVTVILYNKSLVC